MNKLNIMNSKRKTTLILIAIAFLLFSAIVYAALSGVLTISGTTTTTANTDVIFTNVTAKTGEGFVEPDFEVSPDGHSITFSAELTEPDVTARIDYKMKNIGSTNARIYAPMFTYDEEKISFLGEDNKMTVLELFKPDADAVREDDSKLLEPRNYGLRGSAYIAEGTTNEYITIVPGAVMTAYVRLSWRGTITALPPGEYEGTININFEAAT
jgi:hypothetical protein